MTNLLYIRDVDVRGCRITKDGDFLIETEATPSHVQARNALPVRKVKGTTLYRVFVTEILENHITLPFCTVTVDKKALA